MPRILTYPASQNFLPTQATTIDRSGALAQNLDWVTTFGGYEITQQGKAIYTRAGSGLVPQYSTLGQGLATAGTGYWTTGSPILVGNNWAVLISLQFTSTGQSNRYLSHDNGGLGQNAIIYGYVANTVELFATYYTGTDPRSASAIVINDTLPHTLLYQYNGVTFQGYLDGKLVFSTAITFSFEANPLGTLGGTAGGANIPQAIFYMVGRWTAPHNPNAARQLTQFPFTLFRPSPRKMWLDQVAAGSPASIAFRRTLLGVGY